MEEKKIIILDGILDIRSNQTFILFTYGDGEKENKKAD